MAAGTWRASGGSSCYWKRLKGSAGTLPTSLRTTSAARTPSSPSPRATEVSRPTPVERGRRRNDRHARSQDVNRDKR
jgi:hypothetical protein